MTITWQTAFWLPERVIKFQIAKNMLFKTGKEVLREDKFARNSYFQKLAKDGFNLFYEIY